jgi:nicotinamidase-related amidase
VEASGVINRLQQIEQACRSLGIAIFYAQADHRADRRDFRPVGVDRGTSGKAGKPARLSSPPISAGSTWPAEVISEISPRPDDYVIKKHRWSAFYQTYLELSLRAAGIDTLMMAGGAIEIGIASTAYSARDNDLNIIVLSDACTTRDPEVGRMFLEEVFPIYARVMKVEQAIELMPTRPTR